MFKTFTEICFRVHKTLSKKEHSHKVFITIDDTDQTHTLTSATDLIIQFDPTSVLISAAIGYSKTSAIISCPDPRHT